MLFARVFLVCVGGFMVLRSLPTLTKVLNYYIRPKTTELQMKLWRKGDVGIIDILVLQWGIGLVLAGILAGTGGDFSKTFPVTLLDALLIFSLVAVVEEVVFRIVPWIVLFTIRHVTKRNALAEWLNILLAVLISVLFGLAHIINFTDTDLRIYLLLTSQMTGGLMFWYLTDQRGLLSPIVAHFLFNFCIWGVGWLAS